MNRVLMLPNGFSKLMTAGTFNCLNKQWGLILFAYDYDQGTELRKREQWRFFLHEIYENLQTSKGFQQHFFISQFLGVFCFSVHTTQYQLYFWYLFFHQTFGNCMKSIFLACRIKFVPSFLTGFNLIVIQYKRQTSRDSCPRINYFYPAPNNILNFIF